MRYAFDFNNGFVGSGLTFTLVRDSTGFAPNGDVSLPHTPRYAKDNVLLCSAPIYETVDESRGSNTRRVLAAGRRSNGEPYVVYRVNGGAYNEIIVAVGNGSFEYVDEMNPTKGVYRFTTSGNMLFQQNGLGIGTAEQSNYRFGPAAAETFKDLIIIECDVSENFAGTFRSSRFGAVYANVNDIVNGVTDPWKVWFLDLNSGTGTAERCTQWSLTKSINPEDKNECMVGFSDYRSLEKTGYRAVVGRIKHDPVANTYDVQPAALVNEVSGFIGMHCHFIYNLYDGGIVRSVLSVGDGLGTSHVGMRAIPTGIQYWSDATGWGGIGDAFKVYAASTGWNDYSVILGVTGTLGQSGVRTHYGNQVVGAGPSPIPGTFICGADEHANTLSLFSYDGNRNIAKFQNLFLPALVSRWHIGSLQFQIYRSDTGEYICNSSPTPATNSGMIRSNLFYSPDGLNYGVAAWSNQSTQIYPYLVDDTIYFGALSNTIYGTRSVTKPNWELKKPLVVAPNNANYMVTGVRVPTSAPTAGNTTRLAHAGLLPPGVPHPPSTGTIFEIISVNNSVNLGNYTLSTTSGTPGISENMQFTTIKGYLYAIPYGGTGIHQSVTGYAGYGIPSVGFQIFPNGQTQGVSYNAQTFGSEGEWVPWQLRAKVTDFANATHITSGWRCDLRVNSAPPSGCTSQFYLCLDSLTTDENVSAGHGAVPGSAATQEIATISGFACQDRWAIGVKAMIPWDKYDHLESPTGNIGMVTLTDGSKSISMFNRFDTTGKIGLNITDGSVFTHVDNESVSIMRAAPVLSVFNYVTGHLTLTYSVNGSPIQHMAVTGLNINPKAVVFGESPLWIFGGFVQPDHEMNASQISGFLCNFVVPQGQSVSGYTRIDQFRPINAPGGTIIKGTTALPAASTIDQSNNPISSTYTAFGSGFIPTSGHFLTQSNTKQDFRIDRRINDTAAESGKRAVFRSGFRNIVDNE